MPTSGVIKFRDSLGLSEHIYISDVLGTSELATFANGLISFTSSDILKLSYTDTHVVSLQGIGAPFTDIRALGVAYFKNLGIPGKVIRFSWPDPSLDDFEYIQYTGHRMKSIRGATLANLLSALTGHNLQFTQGSIT